MNILFLTLSNMENMDYRGLYIDLVKELDEIGTNVYIVSPRQKRQNLPTKLTTFNSINILKVRTGNITQTKSFIEKGISTVILEYQFLSEIKKNFKNIKFDMIIYSTPPITFNRIIKYFKKKYNSFTYLMLKDIFPQNAVDLDMIKKNGLIYRYFRRKEIKLYENSDMIGCMSKANIDYVLKHNKNIDEKKIELFPNAIKPIARKNKRFKDKNLLESYNIPQDKTLFIYGGNLGKPQGIEFLLEVIDNFFRVENAHLIIVGSGTEYNKIKIHLEKSKSKNVSLFSRLPKDEYDRFVDSVDVGLIFLDRRFTIPNFPSRLTSYMENSLPILAATDVSTDLKDILIESDSGFWCESKEVNDFIYYANILSKDNILRNQMGLNGRLYLEENYDITKNINIILKHLDGDEQDV